MTSSAPIAKEVADPRCLLPETAVIYAGYVKMIESKTAPRNPQHVGTSAVSMKRFMSMSRIRRR